MYRILEKNMETTVLRGVWDLYEVWGLHFTACNVRA